MAMHEGYGGGVNGAGAGARGGVVITGDRGGIAGSEVDSCGACCFEAEEPVRTEDKWVYVGDGHGSYAQATHMQMVGHGRGDFERETHAQVTGYRCRACCVVLGCLLFLLALLLPIGFANGWWSRYFASYFDAPDQCMTTYSPNFMARTDANALFIRQMCCARGYAHYCVAAVTQTPRTIVVHDRYYTQVKDVPVPHTVPVPIPAPPPKVITHKVMVHTHAYDCDSGLTDYMHTWTPKKQRYCCYLRHIACHTKVTYRPHYHTITKVKHITVPVHVPIPAPPPKVVNKVVNVPIHDPPKVIKVPVPGKPHVVPKYLHKKVPVPVPQPTPPKYHTVRVPVKITDPGKTIKVPVPMPPKTIVKNRVVYKTRHVKVQHIYDCKAGYSNWNSGWSSAKKSWCCSHENKGCPGDHSGHLTKTVVTHVTSHMGPEYYSHHYTTGHATGHYHISHVSPATVVHHVHHYHAGGYHGGSGTTGDHSGTAGYHSHSGTTVVHHHYYHARRLQEASETEGEVADGGDSNVGAENVDGGDSTTGGEVADGGESSVGAENVDGGDSTIGGEVLDGSDTAIGGEVADGGESSVGAEVADGGDSTAGGELLDGDSTTGGEVAESGDSSVGAEVANGSGSTINGEVVGEGDGTVGGGTVYSGETDFEHNSGRFGGGSHFISGLGGEFVENGVEPTGHWNGAQYIHNNVYGNQGSYIPGGQYGLVAGLDGNSFNTWVDGRYGHYDHAGTWLDQQFPHDAWYGEHYGHYDQNGGWVGMTYPHDAWVGGHFGHYNHQGVWVEAAHGGDYHVYHPVEGAQVQGAPVHHVIEKNLYSVRTQTHVIHDPVPVPGQVIHKSMSVPAKPVYDCFSGFHSWKQWTQDQQRYCCYKYSRACTTKTIHHLRYHTIVQNHNIPVPVPKPIPVHLPPPPPKVIKVPVPMPPPPRKVVKVPYPVREPSPDPKVITKVIKYNKPVPTPVVVHKTEKIPVPIKNVKYVKVPVPVPSPPKVVYHTHKVVSHAYDCDDGLHSWQDAWSHSKRLYCCWRRSIGCPHSHTVYHTKTIYHTKLVHQKVKLPPQTIYKDVTVHHTIDIDCNSGFSNWYYGWSNYKKHYCCTHEKRGCPGTWHGFIQGHGELHVAHVGHATGRIYDCEAGFSNWLHGWSDSKKKWCCSKESKGCVKFHGCDNTDVRTWSSEKRDWCCGNFQRGCPQTTLSALGCRTPCEIHGETSTCQERIHWARDHVFGGKGNACTLAYSQIQVECDVCRSCTVEAAGCTVTAVAKDPYDCDAALNNFFRAWSPPKKQWCCNNRGKGCEGNSPPKVDPGAGMKWKHVQVNGYWTWQVVAGGGALGPASLPYDCNVGVVNWKIGWSAPKKTWCCAHNKVGCPGSAGGVAGHATHVTVHYTHATASGAAATAGSASSAGAAGSFSAHGGSFTHVHHEIHVVHHH